MYNALLRLRTLTPEVGNIEYYSHSFRCINTLLIHISLNDIFQKFKDQQVTENPCDNTMASQVCKITKSEQKRELL